MCDQVSKASLVRSDLTQQGYGSASNLEYNEKIKAMMKEGKTIYHFGFGQSPFPLFEKAVLHLKENLHQSAYLPVQGIPELREAVCEFHLHYDGVKFNSDNVIVAPGSKELILLLMTVFKGDILINSPSWTTYKPQAILAGRTPFILDSLEKDEWRITPETIQKLVEIRELSEYKLLIFTNPDNPTGTSYTAEQLKKLTEVFRENKILVLCDEIYGRLHYKGSHECLSKYYPEGTILSTGFSKWASAGGWRVGYQIYPKELSELKKVVVSAGSHSYSCAPAPMQYGLAQALNDIEACDEYIRHTTRVMATVGNFCTRELRKSGVTVVDPSAGYYIFPNFDVVKDKLAKRGVTTGTQMCELILTEASVALLPGGPAHLRPEGELTTRLCFVNFNGSLPLTESRKRGMQNALDDQFVKEFCSPVYYGILALRDWVNKQKEL